MSGTFEKLAAACRNAYPPCYLKIIIEQISELIGPILERGIDLFHPYSKNKSN